jgi:hypothetical protein
MSYQTSPLGISFSLFPLRFIDNYGLFDYGATYEFTYACGLITCSSPFYGDFVDRLQEILVSLLSAIQATGFLAFTLTGLFPAEHTSLSWTHNPV